MPKFGNGNGNAEKTKDQLYIKSLEEVFPQKLIMTLIITKNNHDFNNTE
jgi:hypothetical protein